MDAKHGFIATLTPYAIADFHASGVLPSLTLAQACLESNWGRSELTVDGKNLFGVKGNADNGKLYLTNEYINGVKTTVQAYFKYYASFAESIADHSLILHLPRYERVLAAKDYKDAAIMVQVCGYATDPAYSTLLIDIIEQFGLEAIDKEVFSMDDWKQKIVEDAKAAGLLSEEHNAEDLAPKWFVCAVALAVLKKEGGK